MKNIINLITCFRVKIIFILQQRNGYEVPAQNRVFETGYYIVYNFVFLNEKKNVILLRSPHTTIHLLRISVKLSSRRVCL